jgi:hypothetical protein
MGKKIPIRQKAHDPAEEYLILVGAPSNTFNGYYHFDSAINDFVGEPAPFDTSKKEIERYIKGDGVHPVETHDLYWAGFIYSAVKLIETRHTDPDTGSAKPQVGDILTFMLYEPGYEDRQKVDWDASPYNAALHSSSPWVLGKKPYDPNTLRTQQGQNPPVPSLRHVTKPTAHPAHYSQAEADINHDILMRTTSEFKPDGTDAPDGAFHKRPHDVNDYENKIHDIPRRLSLGARWTLIPPINSATPPLFGVLVKVLLMRTENEFYDYLQKGTWTDKRWVHILDTADEKDAKRAEPMANCFWDAFGLIPAGGKTYPSWKPSPSVDRTKVKIKRFDYFGHSGPVAGSTTEDAFYISYGWQNKKGDLPGPDVSIVSTTFKGHLSPNLFTKDGFVMLWGCNLGQNMAPMMSPFAETVVACPNTTSFDHILDDEKKMPEPVPGANWQTRSSP